MDQPRHTINHFTIWKRIIADVRSHAELLRQLLSVGFSSQFKRTILGNLWHILDPLLSILIWLMLARSGMFRPGVTEMPYPAYLIISFTLWIFFEGFFIQIGQSISESGRMLMEAPFPLEINVLEKAIINVFNFLIPLSITFFVFIIMGVNINITILLFIPALIPLMLLGVAMGMFFSLLEVVMLDIYLLTKRCFRILLYITPIVYAPHFGNGLLNTITAYNPLTYLISVPRDLITGASSVSLTGYWISSGISLVVFLMVVHFYFISKKKIIEKLLD